MRVLVTGHKGDREPVRAARAGAVHDRPGAGGGAASGQAVRTPDYVRDNIHVSLLARAYADFAGRLPEGGWSGSLGVSGYRESQGAFARRFGDEIGGRLGIDTPLQLVEQSEWGEPAVRINRDQVDAAALGWSEQAAWDGLAGYYADLPDPG